MRFGRSASPLQPDDPSYESLIYREMAPRWEYLWDMYCGSDNWLYRQPGGDVFFGEKTRVYLPPEPNEPGAAYRSRVLMSLFDRRFARSVRIYVDLVLRDYSLEIPKGSSFDPSNVGRGTPFYNFWSQVATNALVFGHTFVLVDRDPGIYKSEFERRQRGRPFLVSYSPLDLINWRIDDDGAVRLAVFREHLVKPVGSYGEELVTRYRVLRPGGWELWEGEPGALEKVGGGELRGVSLVAIYSHQIGQFMSDPPLKTLADLNLVHYQLSSDHRQKIHKCCLPTPVRIGAMGQGNELVLGPNTFVDLPDGGDFKWAEPLSLSLGESRRDIEAIERVIDLYSLDYLTRGVAGGSSRATAFETRVSAAPALATLSGFSRRFEYGIQEVLQQWASLAGEPAPVVRLPARLKMDRPDSQTLLLYVKLAEIGGISKRTLLEVLREQEYLPKDFDIERELSFDNR